jgi:selenophosphate synthase
MMEISYVTSVTVIAPLVTPPVITAAIPATNAIVVLLNM